MGSDYRKNEREFIFLYSLFVLIHAFLSVTYKEGEGNIGLVFFFYLVLMWAIYLADNVLDERVRGYGMTGLLIIYFVTYRPFSENMGELVFLIITINLMVSRLNRKELSGALFFTSIALGFLDCFLSLGEIMDPGYDRHSYILRLFTIWIVIYMSYESVMENNNLRKDKEKLERELEEKEAEKSEFMANISHELRTPLNAVSGFISRFHESDLNMELRDQFMGVRTASKRLESIVRDVLDFSELQTGSFTLAPREYNLSSVINDCVNTAIAANEKKRLKIAINCAPDIPRCLFGDDGAIGRVITNLMDNAIKYTPRGNVYLNVGFRREDYGINLLITVEDSGIGIDGEQLESIFDRAYTQKDSSADREAEGLGLGLALTKRLLDSMNGMIHIESEPGKGTKVRVTIPQKVVEEAPMLCLEDTESIKLAFYNDPRGYTDTNIAARYMEVLDTISEGLNISIAKYGNMREVLGGLRRGRITHLLITSRNYIQNWEEIDSIDDGIKILIIQDCYEEPAFEVLNNFRILYEPFYTASIVLLLDEQGGNAVVHDNVLYGFTAPEASILVVDDNEMNIKVLDSFLKPYNMKVYSANSGEEAIKKVEERTYDLIFMDYMMPGMDGVECLHRIRNLDVPTARSVPIVALTAHAASGARNMFISEGFLDYLTKPINIAALERVLKNYLPEGLIKPNAPAVVVKRTASDGGEGRTDNASGEETVLDGNVSDGGAGLSENSSGQGTVLDDKSSDGGSGHPENASGQGQSLIDKAEGLKYSCDSEELYLALANVFFEDAPASMERMEELFAAGDIKEYTVLTHSLKSNALQIGAVKLSEESKAMELAGKSGDEDFVKRGHEPLMAHYKKVLSELETMLRS